MRPGQGWPLGHLVGWLAAAEDAVTVFVHKGFEPPSLEVRQAAREQLVANPAYFGALLDAEFETPEGVLDEPQYVI